MIHACGLVEAARDFVFSPGFVAAARGGPCQGRTHSCDAFMVAQGVTRARLPADNPVLCTLREPEVAARAAEIGNTRTAAALTLWATGWRARSWRSAMRRRPCSSCSKMLRDGAPKPAAILGMPVGFVGAAESKDALAEKSYGVPFAIVRGRLGAAPSRPPRSILSRGRP